MITFILPLEEFLQSKAPYGRIIYPRLKADVAYSPTGSGTYLTLRNIEATSWDAVAKFLAKWESKHVFCVYSLEFNAELEERGYTSNGIGGWRIGLPVATASDEERMAAIQAKRLPSNRVQPKYKNRKPVEAEPAKASHKNAKPHRVLSQTKRAIRAREKTQKTKEPSL